MSNVFKAMVKIEPDKSWLLYTLHTYKFIAGSQGAHARCHKASDANAGFLTVE